MTRIWQTTAAKYFYLPPRSQRAQNKPLFHNTRSRSRTTGPSKTRPHSTFAKWELDDVSRNTEKWITELEVLRGDLQTIDVQCDNS